MKKLYSVSLVALSISLLACGFSLAQDGLHWSAQDGLYQTPLPKGAEAYADIDGKKMWQDVKAQADIARKFRDNGHPQYWGRIVATSSDKEDVDWLLGKFHQAGVTDTRVQTVKYYDPQWMGKSWTVTLTGGGKEVNLASAQPPYASTTTGGKTLDLEVVYAGLGSEADFAGRDVKGKAVLIIQPQTGSQDLTLGEKKGAAAILIADASGGNHKYQAYRVDTTVPTFYLGTQDGMAIRDMVGSGAKPHLKIFLDGEMLANQESYLVWATLPGATDETIYIISHRDGFFDAAGDNASGVATMLGIAEHYAKIPQAQRKRTMVFIGTEGHHNNKPGGYGREWLVANRGKFFNKTALMINMEHPAEVLTHGDQGTTTAVIPNDWYAGGDSRPQLQQIAFNAFREFGLPVWTKPSQRPPGGDVGRFYWFLPGLVAQSNDFQYFHTDADTPENVSWAGLEAAGRAYARIIDEVNKIPLSDLQRPAPADPNGPDTAQGYMSLKGCEAWIADSTKSCNK